MEACYPLMERHGAVNAAGYVGAAAAGEREGGTRTGREVEREGEGGREIEGGRERGREAVGRMGTANSAGTRLGKDSGGERERGD